MRLSESASFTTFPSICYSQHFSYSFLFQTDLNLTPWHVDTYLSSSTWLYCAPISINILYVDLALSTAVQNETDQTKNVSKCLQHLFCPFCLLLNCENKKVKLQFIYSYFHILTIVYSIYQLQWLSTCNSWSSEFSICKQLPNTATLIQPQTGECEE